MSVNRAIFMANCKEVNKYKGASVQRSTYTIIMITLNRSIMQIDTLVDRATPRPLGPTLFARLNDIHVYKSNYLEKSK